METWSVEEWLEKAGMGRYAQAFLDNGYDTPDLCANLKDEDLDAVGVVSKQHRSKIFAQAKILLELEAATSSQANDSYNNNNMSTSPPSIYSEPWTGGSRQNGVAIHATEATDSHSAVIRKASGEKKKGTMPPVKMKRQIKQKRAPTSSSLPPAPYQRDEGAPVLTNLQLKLKIREELQKDGILLSEPPYCQDGDQLVESQLVELAERYSQRFRVDSLGVYDALVNVWQHSINKSGLVIPARDVEKKPSESSSSTLDSTSNYDEPFDTQSGASPRPLARVASHEVPMIGKPKLSPKKSQTLPPHGFQDQNYDEPFDTVSTPTPTGSSPKQLKAKGDKQTAKQDVQTPPAHLHNPPIKRSASSGSSPEEKRKLSADSAGPRSPHTSPRTSPHSSPHTSPKHSPITTKPSVFRRFWKKQRSHSVREFDVEEETKRSRKKHASKDEHKHRHKRGSAENLVEMGSPSHTSSSKSHRTSVPIITLQEGRPGSPPPPVPSNRHLTSYDSTTSESDDSPHPPKKHQFGTKFRKKSRSPPTRHKATEEDLSSGESYSEQDRGVMPLPRMRKMITTSDFELHKITEDADSRQQSLRLSQSHEELRNTGVTFANPPPGKEEKQAKKPGFISRIFKRRTATPTLRKQSKWGRNRDSTVSESALMTTSKSMPEIALAGVIRRSVDALNNDKPSSTDTGFDEVFDPVQPSVKAIPPPKPVRQHTLRQSSIMSPDESPPMRHRMVIASATSTSPTDHLIPIHSSSAPGVPSYLENGSPVHMIPGTHSLERDKSDSEGQQGEKAAGIRKPSHSASSPQDIADRSESPVPRTDSHSHSPTHLQRDNEQGPPPTGESNLTRSSSGSSTSSTSARKPPPPPKPKRLSQKGRPTPPPTVANKPLESQLEEKEKETEPPTVVPAGNKPPPKPTRSKYRTLRIESGKKTQEAEEIKSKTLGSRTHRSLDENDPEVLPIKPSLLFDRSGSDGSISRTERTSERIGSTGSFPGTPEGLRKPKPLPKPKLLMKVSPASSRTASEEPSVPQALETLLYDKLSEEGIDLTQIPYSSVWGVSTIPSLLISRYASELGQSEEAIAPTLDKIRGKKLQEQSRDYVVAKQSSWQTHTQINTDDVDGFLTSVGLPMYSQAFKQNGYVAVQQISELGGAGLDTFGLKPGHSEIILRHLPAL